MARRLARAGVQLGLLVSVVLFLVFFLDNRYRVLPQAIHNHLPLHHEGLVITDITVKTCSSLNPIAKCQLDPAIWHRVEKDLYLGSAYFSKAYIHIKRKKEEDLTDEDKVIVDVRAGKLDPTMADKSQASEKWESRPAGVWIKRSAKRHASDSRNSVTAVDVLFGADVVEPRPGWELVPSGPLRLDTNDNKEPRLTIRRGLPHKVEKPVPRIRKDGKFKIMQISDLHLSTGVGKCREPEPPEWNGGKCEADPRTLEFVDRLLDEEKPDIVVLSGDQVNGGTAPDVPSALFKIIAVLVERKIPYAAIFGNHDDEGGVISRQAQMQLLESLPYSLSEAGSNQIDGVGNYFVEILAQGNNKHSAITLYFLDSHSYSPDPAKFKGYDWIKPSQITWFRSVAESLKESHSRYTHTHLNMAFIHIPLPEYRIKTNPFVGSWKEGVTAPGFNTHFRDALVEQNVKAVSCGHDHANDYCMMSKDAASGEDQLWMCYAGGSGFGGYGGYGGYIRRLRLFEIDTNQARITTWKRLEYGDTAARLDEQIIVDSGRIIPPQVPQEGQ